MINDKFNTNELKQILFVTASFPYPPGEQFIESEIEHWSNLSWAKVMLLPNISKGAPRTAPNDIKVLPSASLDTKMYKIIFILRASFSLLLWREIAYLIGKKRLTFATGFTALRSVAKTLKEKLKLTKTIQCIGHVDVAYCYWNTESSYAACLLKEKRLISRVISRAHRFDLYEERRSQNYMPLKRQFVHTFDKIYAISNEGEHYLHRTYGFSPKQLTVSRLGVRRAKKLSMASSANELRIVSTSFCVPVKRIHLIIAGIRSFAQLRPQESIFWTHVGDGPLRENLEKEATQQLGKLNNIRWHFSGMLKNDDVLKFYERNTVDVFINCSVSEGVPVSIMEAMAHGIPAIAPSIGGIPELIDKSCGVLLPINFSIGDIVSAIERVSLKEHKNAYRIAAQERINNLYSAEKNYTNFVKSIKDELDPEGSHQVEDDL